MKLGAGLGGRADPEAFARRARQLEDAGVEYLWTGEAYTADAVSALGFLAAVTSKAKLGTNIMPIYSRTPTLIAMTAVGMDQLSKGRFVLGLGASGPQVIEGFHGVEYDAPLARTKEIIEICRAVWRRERLVHQGTKYQIPLAEGRGTGLGKPLKIIDEPVRAEIPIFVAALGPKNVEMTAEMAEGWLPLHFWPDRAERVWGEALSVGMAKRDASLGPLEIVAGGALAIGEGAEPLRERTRPMLGLYFGGMGAKGANFYNDVLCRYGFKAEAAEIQDLYLSGHKKEASAKVPAELVEQMSLIGDERFVRGRIEAYRAAGVTVLNVDPIGENKLADLETLARWIED